MANLNGGTRSRLLQRRRSERAVRRLRRRDLRHLRRPVHRVVAVRAVRAAHRQRLARADTLRRRRQTSDPAGRCLLSVADLRDTKGSEAQY